MVVLGPERAMMKHPEAQAGFLVKGSANIDAMLAKGWVILVCDRNHLIREYRPEAFGGVGLTVTHVPPVVSIDVVYPDQPKRGPGRPKKKA